MLKVQESYKDFQKKCFLNSTINFQLNLSGKIHKVFHTEDLEALLKVDDLDSFLMNL